MAMNIKRVTIDVTWSSFTHLVASVGSSSTAAPVRQDPLVRCWDLITTMVTYLFEYMYQAD